MTILSFAPRILLDLSYGALGYSGIPQETRLLFKALTGAKSLDTSGLIFGITNAAVRQAPVLPGSRDRQIEHQADILFRFVHGDQKPPTTEKGGIGQRLMATWQSALQSWRVLLSRRGRLGELNRDVFWDTLWRRWLAPTLAESDLHLARQSVVYLSDVSTAMMHARTHYGLPGPRLDTRGFDFALFHEARPVRVDPQTCKVIRHYDLIPALRPDLVGSPNHIRGHIRAVRRCEHDSIFTCISESAREDLVQAFPHLAERAVTIPCTLADGYYPERLPKLLPRIVAARNSSTAAQHPPASIKRLEKSGLTPYILIVSTIEPRKNHMVLVRAYERVLARHRTDLRLVIVGTPGWQFHETLQVMAPHIRSGRLIHLDKVPQAELRVLYSHAEAVVFPSLYEGFGYSPLEGMCCGAPAIASNIAAHLWAYGDAAEYCDPYSVDSIARTIERVCLSPSSGLREELIARGYRRITRYRVQAVAAQWEALFAELRRQGITNNVRDARLAGFNEQLRAIEREQEALAEHASPFQNPDLQPHAA